MGWQHNVGLSSTRVFVPGGRVDCIQRLRRFDAHEALLRALAGVPVTARMTATTGMTAAGVTSTEVAATRMASAGVTAEAAGAVTAAKAKAFRCVATSR